MIWRGSMRNGFAFEADGKYYYSFPKMSCTSDVPVPLEITKGSYDEFKRQEEEERQLDILADKIAQRMPRQTSATISHDDNSGSGFMTGFVMGSMLF